MSSPAAVAERPAVGRIFERACDHFDQGEFFEAHEAWEEIWTPLPPSPARRSLQGLIQLAAAYVQVGRGNARPAERLFAAALEKIEPGVALPGDLDLTPLRARARRDLELVLAGRLAESLLPPPRLDRAGAAASR